MSQRLLALGLTTSLLLITLGVASILLGEADERTDADALARCERKLDPVKKERCLASARTRLEGGAAQERAAAGPTPEARDLIRLELITRDPSLSRELCPTMEGDQAKRLCEQVEARPHLWMESSGSGRRRSGSGSGN